MSFLGTNFPGDTLAPYRGVGITAPVTREEFEAMLEQLEATKAEVEILRAAINDFGWQLSDAPALRRRLLEIEGRE